MVQQDPIMVSNSRNLFNSQLPITVNKYSNLREIQDGDDIYLKGVLDIPDDNGNIIGNFMIEIKYCEGYPYRFPKLFETGGDIPDNADNHKYNDGSCCITVAADEILKCKNGISVVQFIKDHAIPYFANQIYKKVTGHYKNGEFSHEIEGIQEFYETLFKSSDKSLWISYFSYTFGYQEINCKRYDPCFCGSKLKYNKCHLKIFNKLMDIGKKQVYNDFNLIMS